LFEYTSIDTLLLTSEEEGETFIGISGPGRIWERSQQLRDNKHIRIVSFDGNVNRKVSFVILHTHTIREHGNINSHSFK
jgi:hypothetical protein